MNGPAEVHPDSLALFALGLLDDVESGEVEDHVASCARCRAELADLAKLRAELDAAPADRVLSELDAPDAAPPVRDDDLVLRRALKQVRDEASEGGRSRRYTLVAAALVACAATGIAGGAIGRGTAPEPPPVAIGTVSQANDPVTGAGMTVRVRAAKAWTRLSVSVTGVPAGEPCRVVAIADDGRREYASSWVVGAPVPGQAPTFVDGAAAIAPQDLKAVELVTVTGVHLVTVSV